MNRSQQNKFHKRLWFVGQATERFKASVELANDWYVNNKAAKLDNEDALRKFAQWYETRA